MIFVKEFFKNTKQIGSIIPSSSFLSKAIVSKINYKTANVIVELGAGTGVFTKMLVNNLNLNTKLFVFEINPLLYKVLHNKFSHLENVYIINTSAENLTNILSLYGVNKVDYILSGLPFLNFSTSLKNCIFTNIYSSLKLSGELILFQYTRFLEKDFLDFFVINDIEKVYLNFPPANIYTLVKKIK
ncbi:class I SAM-dependent methyltransferase [Cetobacterium somerae]|uniref:class I SAM-dependent methyltransferase n=1 Tax=Cetobacterium somerae TaxID=188913 RepID=UPI0038922D42